MTDTTRTTGEHVVDSVLVVDLVLGFLIIGACYSLRPSDTAGLVAALFLLMNLKTWTPR